jgi:transcriptional regulator
MEHSAALEPGFAPDSLTERYVETSLRSMVGLELVVDRVEAKAKMGQNQSPEKLRRVIAGLRGAGCAEVADWMERFSLSRAEDKQALLAGIRAKRAL